MGYYSTLTAYSFKVEDCEKAKKIFKEYNQKYRKEQFAYSLEILNPAIRQANIIPESYYAKHNADKKLAEAISKVIANDEVTEIYFCGEDDTLWGYRIYKNKVIPLTGIFISDQEALILEKCKRLDINAVKFVLEQYLNNMNTNHEEFANAMMELHPTLQQILIQKPFKDFKKYGVVEFIKGCFYVSWEVKLHGLNKNGEYLINDNEEVVSWQKIKQVIGQDLLGDVAHKCYVVGNIIREYNLIL